MKVSSFRSRRGNARQDMFQLILLLVFTTMVFLAELAPRLLQVQNSTPQSGDIAEQDILAPRTLSYESPLLTQRQRDAAANAVAPVYTPLDTSIARNQLEQLRSVLNFISAVRADEYASTQQKMTDLSALENIQIDQTIAQSILVLSEPRWQVVQDETIAVLESVMQATIRSDQVEEIRRNVPAMVSLNLPDTQSGIVASLATAFVTANSVYDQVETAKARQKARELVQPVTQTYAAGQTIVTRGSVMTPVILEAMDEFELTQSANTWQEAASAALYAIVTSAYFISYFRRNRSLTQNQRGLLALVVLFLLFLFGARLTIPGHTVLPYLFPTMAFSLTLTALFRSEVALVATLPLSMLIAYRMPNALELTIFYILCSFFGVLSLRQPHRLSSYIRSGLNMAFAGAAVMLLFRLNDNNTDVIGLLTLAGAGLANGITSIFVALLLQQVVAQFLGLTTPLQLIELSRPDNPLLQFMLRNAPGTYQHTLQVANLAEQAAERIGADALLVRVGALYHDAGKSLNPLFFIENQMPGFPNPHDDLPPELSAVTIIRHVADGLELARKYRLPPPVRSFVSEHHGTMLARYQYVKAVEAAGGDESLVDESLYRYPGPRPQTRETALLMLADSSEARLRAGSPRDVDQIRAMIQEVVDERIKTGELIDTTLTLKDLDIVVNSFVETLRGVYHPRLEYPAMPPKPAPLEAPAVPAALPAASSQSLATPDADTNPGKAAFQQNSPGVDIQPLGEPPKSI